MPELKTDGASHTNIFRQMTPATQNLARDFEEKLAREKRDGLLIRHEMGTQIQKAMEAKATYGSAAVQQLAAYLAVSPDRLYKLRTFAQVYPRDQVEEWTNRKMKNGGRLRFNHLAAIMVVQPEDERLRLVERAFVDSLSVRELMALIEGCRKRKSSKGGRKPKSIGGGLQQLIARGRTFLKGFPVWEEVVFKRIDEAEPKTIDPAVRNRVIEAQLVLDELTAQIKEATICLARNLERIDRD